MKFLSSMQEDALFASMRKCGEIMRRAHENKDINSGIVEKAGSANFVTAYDVLVQKTLIEDILCVVPTAVFMAEEQDNDAAAWQTGLCFVIDPIDGTTNFIHDYKASSISVGLLADGMPVFGAVYDPYKDELFWAHADGEACCNGKKISVSKNDLPHALICFGSSPYYKNELAESTFALAKELFMAGADIRRGGSAAIDICNVACGRADVFFEQQLSPWDYMASFVILRQAGGEMLNYSGREVTFEQAQSVLCVNSILKEDALKITKKYQ